MVSSVLSPEKVVGRQNTNRAAAQNFISGGSVLGASVLNSAANKIVGFQRAGVQPAPSATGSIVSTISTNINNNVTSTINKTLQGFSADYQKRIKQVDDAKPIGILGKFLNVYKTALGFINFFGNKRNIDKVRDNLEALKKSFTESFEVAKLIRQVIIKIVKQLSNLPVASPSGGGGLNLDVDIPGGGLKKTAPRGLGRMMRGKGKMLALGAGALGLGAAGGAAVNALSDSPQAAGTSPEIPGDTVDRFSSIVDKFANAISKLFENTKQKPKQQQSSGSSGGGERKSGSPASPGGPVVSSAPGESNLAAFISTLESSQLQDQADVMQSMTNRAGQNYSGYGGLFGQLTAPNQYSPLSAAIHGTTDPKAQTKYGPVADKLGKTPQERIANLQQIISKPDALSQLQTLFGAGNASAAKSLIDDFYSGGPLSKESARFIQGRTDFGASSGVGGALGSGQIKRNSNTFGAANASKGASSLMGIVPSASVLPSPAQVAAAPTSTQARQQIAQQVSQPPAAQQPVVMPINLGGGGQQQSGGGSSGGGGGGSQGSGPSVPFLPAGNPDNFLVLYSRMVYNIVDG
jgi:hypothetical protein